MDKEIVRMIVKQLFDALETMGAGRPFVMLALNMVEQMILGLVATDEGARLARQAMDALPGGK